MCVDFTFAQVIPLRNLSVPAIYRDLFSWGVGGSDSILQKIKKAKIQFTYKFSVIRVTLTLSFVRNG